MLRKLYVAIDCEDEEQKIAVQNMLKELSEAGVLKSRQLITMYPLLKSHRAELQNLFNIITSKEKGMTKSMKVAGAIAKLMK